MDKGKALEKLLRFDLIRASKLLEMIQGGIIIFAIAFYVGSLIDRFFNNLIVVDDNMSNAGLIGVLLGQLAVIIVTAYYIKKVSATIPFFFSLTDDYKSNMKGEANFSGGLATAIIFVSTQSSFLAKISILRKRFALN